ncbi:hypothetical protein GCM10027085_08370 [Spirosoma aerophilum]
MPAIDREPTLNHLYEKTPKQVAPAFFVDLTYEKSVVTKLNLLCGQTSCVNRLNKTKVDYGQATVSAHKHRF